jgi:TPR repeat protein
MKRIAVSLIVHGLTIAVLAFSANNGIAFAGTLEDGIAAIRRAEYATALKILGPLAKQGDVEAQNRLGVMYRDATGARDRVQDYKEAMKWFRLAAAQGNVTAQLSLATIYYDGRAAGVAQDYNEAVKWFRLAAAQENVPAQLKLATIYLKGLGVEQDYNEAVKWFRLAANQGSGSAQNSLGYMYHQGLGVTEDYKEALKWYQLAVNNGKITAAQGNIGVLYLDGGLGVEQNYNEAYRWFKIAATNGHAESMNHLGSMYNTGRGVTRDSVRAYMWFNLAAAKGHSDSEKDREIVTSRMTPHQIEQAQEMARRCAASDYKQCYEPTYAAAPPQQYAARPNQPAPIQEAAKPQKSSGTGFFVSSDGYLITNAHVVDSCDTLHAIDDARNQFPAQVVRISTSDDLALLKANTRRNSVAVFRDSVQIIQGETVIAYGYPLAGLLASTGNVSTGLVTALAGLRDDPRQMQISAPIQPGNSGGPLVDKKGAVIGVIVAKLNAIAVARITADIPQNINFAIKASAVTNLLDANSVRYRRETPQQDLAVETLTQKMKEYTAKIECN